MPNAYKFENFLKDYANKDDVFVIAILISMELSPTKLQVQMAADNLGMKNIFIEESASATVGQGAIICELCKFIEKEQDIEKIKREFYRLRDSMRIFAVVDDLKYLRSSGRLSGASAVLGKMLNVKPIIAVQDGKILNISKCMGTIKADNFIIDKMKNVDSSHPLYVVHSDTPENAERLKNKIKPLLSENQEIVESEIGYVVGSHVGPKCYGYGFFEKQ